MTLLEKITQVCLIAASLGSLVFMYETHHGRNTVRGSAQPALVGKKLGIEGDGWHKQQLNAVIALSQTCRYCAASLPFYRKLSAARRDSKRAVSLTVVSSEPVDAIRTWLDKEGITADGIFQSNLTSLGVKATPTVLLVDKTGNVKKRYDGLLTPSAEEELLSGFKTGGL